MGKGRPSPNFAGSSRQRSAPYARTVMECPAADLDDAAVALADAIAEAEVELVASELANPSKLLAVA